MTEFIGNYMFLHPFKDFLGGDAVNVYYDKESTDYIISSNEDTVNGPTLKVSVDEYITMVTQEIIARERD